MTAPSSTPALAALDRELADRPELRREQVPLGPLTTYRVGGPAARFAGYGPQGVRGSQA